MATQKEIETKIQSYAQQIERIKTSAMQQINYLTGRIDQLKEFLEQTSDTAPETPEARE